MIVARERKGLKMQGAQSEYTQAIQPLMLPQQVVVRNPAYDGRDESNGHRASS